MDGLSELPSSGGDARGPEYLRFDKLANTSTPGERATSEPHHARTFWQMSTWIPVHDALPEEGTAVQFTFNGRALVLRGVFRYGAFTSRWSRYLPAEVGSWRALGPEETMLD